MSFNPVIKSEGSEKVRANNFVSPKHPRSICIVNYKGGVGKTTITCLLGYYLSQLSEKIKKDIKVLMLDIDPQCSLSLAVGFEPEKVNQTDYTMFNLVKPTKWSKLAKTVTQLPTYIKSVPDTLAPSGLFIIPGSFNIDDLDMAIAESIAKEGARRKDELFLYCKQLLNSFSDYDYVLIDCPPNKMFLTQAMLRASSFYLPVTIPDSISIYGMPRLLRWVKEIPVNDRPFMLGYVLNALNRSGGLPDGKVYSQQYAEQELQKSIQNDLLPLEKTILGSDPVVGSLPRLDRIARFMSERGAKFTRYAFSEKASNQPTIEECLSEIVTTAVQRIKKYRAKV